MTGTRGRSATAHWLATVTLEWPAAQATLLDARGAIDALAHRREQLERQIVGAPHLAVGAAGRPAALPARRRHADRGRTVRRDRRLRAVRPRRAADELRRPGPIRGDDRPAAPARRDHEDRLRTRPAAAGRSRLALPRPPEHRHCAHRPPRQPARPKRSRSPGQPSGDCTAPGPASRPAPSAARSSPSRPPASSPGSPGRSPESSNHAAHTSPIPSAGSVAARQRAGNPRANYEQPAPTGRPRPILDSGSPRRTMVLRRQPAYISPGVEMTFARVGDGSR